jgi:hypothetical protein
METLPEQTDLDARSLQPVPAPVADRSPARMPGSHSPSLALVAGPALVLAQPSSDEMPEGWQSGITRLGQWLDLELLHVAQRPATGFRQMSAWAANAAAVARPASSTLTPPVFAPWQGWSPVALQQPERTGVPRASWVASYLYDYGTGKALKRVATDIVLMSPLAAGCAPDMGLDGPMPEPTVLQAMIATARREGRGKLVIVTDARRRNAMIRNLLQVDRAVTRDDLNIDVLTIEDTLCELVRNPVRWDAIIVLPDLRSLVFAMLAEVTGCRNPWPILWHRRDVCMITAERLDDTGADLPFDGPLLVQALALAAAHAGLALKAQRLVNGAARLWECGIITPGRGSVAPYVTEISDADFIDHLCGGTAAGQRATDSRAQWRAIPAAPASTAGPRPRPVPLRVV